MIFSQKGNIVSPLNLSILMLIVISLFFIIVARLTFLQIFHQEKYRRAAEGNRIYEKRIIAPRGIITDRFGNPVVFNEPKFILRDGNNIKEISHADTLRLEAHNAPDFKKVEILGKRKYVDYESWVHVLGYLGEINSEELKTHEKSGYRLKDFIGRGGIEQYYENILRGENGKAVYEVDSKGQIVNKLEEQAAKNGQTVKLTIDADLQKTANDALQNAVNDPRYTGGATVKGVVVVSAIESGEILALVSSPTYNPEQIGLAINDTRNYPLMNRAVSATYPPGSTFKLVVSVAGLESGRITKNTLVEDIGVIKIDKWEFPTWSSTRDGMMDVVAGIKRSNDIFFYRVGEYTGLSKIQEYGKKFGLGEKLGIDLPAEAEGNLPSNSWKEKVAGEPWYLGDTYHLAIGQGYILTTPLQVNSWTATVANGGKVYRPHLLLNSKFEIRPPASALPQAMWAGNSKQIQITQNQNTNYLIRDLKLKKETIDLIHRGMIQACQTGGTGWPLFDFSAKGGSASGRKIPVACKTGTAEYGDLNKKTHAWFTAFAPADRPEIAVTVLVEEGGQGSDVAAPVARKVLEKYFGVKE